MNEDTTTTELREWQRGGRFFDHSGHRIFYRRAGTGPTLLLVHGYPFSSYEWSKVWPELTAEFDVVAPDMLGMGFSDKPLRHRYSLIDHADMHEALLRHLGVRRAAVLSQDLGVSVVQEMLARRLDAPATPSITAAVFLNGGLFPEVYRSRLIQRVLSSPVGNVVGPMLPDALIRSAVLDLFGPDTKIPADELDTLMRLLRHNRGKSVSHRVGRFVQERAGLRDRLVRPLRTGDTPLLMINGALDPNSGAHMAARYRELVPDPQIVSLARIGHWPQLEAPADVVRHLREFLR
ncbi:MULTISPECIES: alpha/beta fold hydrolase [unclassified Nocardia]|uniref:alpha/beta fold hydrolase n=1 Tax=unclassified Nocardia TaxID=2637762 RepID=UPI0033AB806F